MDEEDKNIKFEFYFSDEMDSFALHLESDETLEADELAEALESFAKQVRSGEFRFYDEADEVVHH